MEVKYLTQSEYDGLEKLAKIYMGNMERFIIGNILDNNLKNKLQKELEKMPELAKNFYLSYSSCTIDISPLYKFEIKEEQFYNQASENFMKQFSDMFGGFNK